LVRRIPQIVVRCVLALVAFLIVMPGHANAQDDDYIVRARVQNQVAVGGETEREPVVGVTIVVLDEGGNEVASGVTDDKGTADIPVPGPATYVVRLDESTLPEGVGVASNSAAEQTIPGDSFTTSRKTVNFFTGERATVTTPWYEKLAQRLADGTRLGLIIAITSVGLSLIFGTTGLTNFAFGEMVTFGAMVAFLLNSTWGWPMLVAAPVAILAGGAFGMAVNGTVFGPLRRRGTGLISQLVISVGLAILLRNFFLYLFGGRKRPYADYTNQVAKDFGPVAITPRDLIGALIALVVLVLVATSLSRTRIGKATRAVSDNPGLASATGINTEFVIRLVWIFGGALAALGGILRGLDEQVGFDMGSDLLFLMFAAITLGGLGSAYGALLGGFIVGLTVELATYVVPTELKATPALIILIVVLLVRPQGILGRAQRVG
jgi:branched-chain amino acid transport system permease protein